MFSFSPFTVGEPCPNSTSPISPMLLCCPCEFPRNFLLSADLHFLIFLHEYKGNSSWQWLQFSGYQTMVHSPVSLGSFGGIQLSGSTPAHELTPPQWSHHSNLRAKVLESEAHLSSNSCSLLCMFPALIFPYLHVTSYQILPLWSLCDLYSVDLMFLVLCLAEFSQNYYSYLLGKSFFFYCYLIHLSQDSTNSFPLKWLWSRSPVTTMWLNSLSGWQWDSSWKTSFSWNTCLQCMALCAFCVFMLIPGLEWPLQLTHHQRNQFSKPQFWGNRTMGHYETGKRHCQ